MSSDRPNTLPKAEDKPSAASDQFQGIRRWRVILLIASLALLAWSACWILLGVNGHLDSLKLPDQAFTAIILVPLVAGVALLIPVRFMFRMTDFK